MRTKIPGMYGIFHQEIYAEEFFYIGVKLAKCWSMPNMHMKLKMEWQEFAQ